MKKPIYMETTQVAAEKTAAEIQMVLIKAGATQIACDYKDGRITGLHWSMPVNGRDFVFAMPARVDPLYKILVKRRATFVSAQDHTRLREQAERVAWRQLLRWIQAQVAMVDVGMVEAREVFLPYLVDPQTGRTVFEVFEGTTYKQIAAPAAQGGK